MILMASCNAPERSGAEGVRMKQETADKTRSEHVSDPIGDWILVEFHDSILTTKRIGSYRSSRPVWSALLLRVGQDSVELHGSLLHHRSVARSDQAPLLMETEAYGTLSFIHDADLDQLVVNWHVPSQPELQGTCHYRRLTKAESVLTEGINRRFGFQENYHAFLLRHLFQGVYTPLGKGHSFEISATGELSGHPEWRTFSFHDYFGTLHPYEQDMDALFQHAGYKLCLQLEPPRGHVDPSTPWFEW